MKPEDLRGIYKDIALQTDVETALMMYKLFNGLQIEFPKKLYSSNYIKMSIKAEYNGSNVQEIAKKYGISKRRVRQILHSD